MDIVAGVTAVDINIANVEMLDIITARVEAFGSLNSIIDIPEGFIDTSDADAVSENILKDKIVYVKGERVIGSMKDNGINYTMIDGLDVDEVDLGDGYYKGIYISFSGALQDRLRRI